MRVFAYRLSLLSFFLSLITHTFPFQSRKSDDNCWRPDERSRSSGEASLQGAKGLASIYRRNPGDLLLLQQQQQQQVLVSPAVLARLSGESVLLQKRIEREKDGIRVVTCELQPR